MSDDAEVELAAMLERRPGHGDGLFLWASLAASRGDVVAAVERLEAALAAHCSDPERHRTDPRFDPIRNDLRFLRVMRDRRHPSAFAEEAS
jgi:hypothetical protein